VASAAAQTARAIVLRRELRRGADSLLDFVPRTNRNFTRPDHLRPVADRMAAAVRGEPVRACVSVPPRHGKTETLLVHGVPWYLSFRPNAHIAYVTYEAELARDKSAAAREIARSIGIELRGDSQSKSHWRTPQGGGLFATGIGGPLTGHGFQLAIVDDPFKNRADAESPTIRQKVHEWFTSTLMTRMEPGAAVIVNMARWHSDDLVGRLEKAREVRWDVLNLPAINENGHALWPGRWPLEGLDVRRREVGTYDWASLFMGMPRPRGSQLFPIDGVYPARYTLPEVVGARGAIICDPAATAKTTADHTAIGVFSAIGDTHTFAPTEAWWMNGFRAGVATQKNPGTVPNDGRMTSLGLRITAGGANKFIRLVQWDVAAL
jgi:hypothetical protein